MGNASGLMASSRTATIPAASGAVIEMYAMRLDTGGTHYVVELYGIPVAEGAEQDQITGVYYFLMAASEAVLGAVMGQVQANDRTPLEV